MSKMRGLFKMVSILAILHLLALGGLIGFLCFNGTLNAERLELMAGVLRGEYDEPAEDASVPPVAETDGAGNARGAIAREQMEEEIARRQLERQKAELDQRLDLVLREMARVRQERDFLEDRRRREAETAKMKEDQRYREGFEKQLDYFGRIKPKDALEYLLSRDVEEAAELLRTMETRKGKKIIEAAKSPNQRRKMDEILKLLPELDVVRGEVAPG